MVREKAIAIAFHLTFSLISIVGAFPDVKETKGNEINAEDLDPGFVKRWPTEDGLEKRSKKMADNLVKEMSLNLAEEMSHMDDGKKDGRATGYRSGYLEQMEELLNSPEVQKLKAKMASDSATLWKKIKELFGKGLGDEGDEGSGSGDTEATNPKNETTTPGGDEETTTPTPTSPPMPGSGDVETTTSGTPAHPDVNTTSPTPGSGDLEPTNPKNETTTPGGDKGPTTPTKPTLVVKTQKTPEAQKLGGDTQDPEGSGTARDEESVTEDVRQGKGDEDDEEGNKGEGDKSARSYSQGVREGEWKGDKGNIG